MLIDLTGRTALVTGASRGLGRAVAHRLARSGAQVIAVGRDDEALNETVRESETYGGRMRTIACDITGADSVADMWRQVEGESGGVDILVNNAGTTMRRPIEDLDHEALISDYELKVGAAIRMIRLAIPAMKRKRWGRIVNTLSIGAKAPGAGSAPTALSRAAGMALTKSLASELAPHNILVNGLCVGFIESGQWVSMHREQRPDIAFDEFLAQQARSRGVPLGRIGRAEEFANAACFLASDQASYITGTVLNVDGGASPVV